jgi:hypothetical protein
LEKDPVNCTVYEKDSLYLVEYYSAIKKNEITSFVGK